MQTFLPYPDFKASAESLDKTRLGNQRLEASILLRTILGTSLGWANHPAARMWRGYPGALALYGLTITEVWVHQGFHDSVCRSFFLEQLMGLEIILPPWLGDRALHISHQSNLIRKNPGHYRPLWPGVPDNLSYYWPGESRPLECP